MKTYPHNFATPLNETTLNEISGYLAALRGLYQFIETETQFDPNKRYIDSVKLLEAISATTDELQPMMKEYLNEMQNKLIAEIKG